jgi:hypothetical protein
MRFEELFRDLGSLAAAIGAQIRDATFQGVLLDELDLTGPAPSEISLLGPAQVFLSDGEVFRLDAEGGAAGEPLRFSLDGGRLGVMGGDRDTVVRVTVPAPRRITVAGAGRMTVAKLAADAEVSMAGSGRLEIAEVSGGRLAVSVAGSGRIAVDGRADKLTLSIAGSGSCDAEGLVVDNAAVHIAGSGDAILTCNGEVTAKLMGSGNVIVRGAARCSVHSMGSGSLTCERERETAD